MKICFLYPGQGAQYPGMGKDLWENNQGVKDLFRLATDCTRINMEKLLFEGSEQDLKATDKTQVAVTLVNLSAALVLKAKGIEAAGAAGFSLGEYAALYDAGIITKNDIFSIVKARGEIMERVSRSLDSPSGNPGMAAVIGLDYNQIDSALKSSGIKDAFIANCNSPDQTVISGTFDGLKKAETVLNEAGAKRYIPLKVSGPFHCPLLKEAGEQMKAVLANFIFANPEKPVYSNVTGSLIKSGAEAKELCIQQITSPVQWVKEEENIIKDGFDKFLEVGPGNVLTGLLKKYTKDFSCYTAGKLNDINGIHPG